MAYGASQGDCQVTAGWWVRLPCPFARRVEDGVAHFERTGLALSFVAFRNDIEEPVAARVAWLRAEIEVPAYHYLQEDAGPLTRFSYRLPVAAEAGCQPAFHACVVGPQGHLRLSARFVHEGDLELVQGIWRSATPH